MTRQYRVWNVPFKQYERDDLWSLKPDGTIMWGTAKWPEAIVEWGTGLKNMDGEEIFEGDICQFTKGESVCSADEVYWNQEWGAWFWRNAFGYTEPFDYLLSVHCKTIGNIRENPELLDEKEEEE